MLDDHVRHAAVGGGRREERFQCLDAARRGPHAYDRERTYGPRGEIDRSRGLIRYSSGGGAGVPAEDADPSCSVFIYGSLRTISVAVRSVARDHAGV